MNREPLTLLTEAEVATYARDGAVALRQVFDTDWIALLAEGVEENLAALGPYARAHQIVLHALGFHSLGLNLI